MFHLYCSYYAIVHPIRAQYMCTLSQAKKVITTTWTLSFLLASPTLLIQVSILLFLSLSLLSLFSQPSDDFHKSAGFEASKDHCVGLIINSYQWSRWGYGREWDVIVD